MWGEFSWTTTTTNSGRSSTRGMWTLSVASSIRSPAIWLGESKSTNLNTAVEWPPNHIYASTCISLLDCLGCLSFCCFMTDFIVLVNWLPGAYRQTSNISYTFVGNNIVDYSYVVGTSPGGAAPTPYSFSTQHPSSMYWAKTIASQDEKQIRFRIWYSLY